MQLEKCKRKSSQKVRLFATSNINLRLLNRTPLPWIKQFGAMPGNVGLVSDPETNNSTQSGKQTTDLQIGGGWSLHSLANWPHHLVDIVNNGEKCEIRIIEKCTYIISCS